MKANNIDMLRVHDHACFIYESDYEWRQTVIPYLVYGLKKEEKCIYVCNTRTAHEIRDYLRGENLNIEVLEKSGQLLLTDYTILEQAEGISVNEICDFFGKFIKNSLDEGYKSLRVTIETGDGLLPVEDLDFVLELNAKVNRDFFPNYPCLCLCQYDRRTATPESLKNAVISHAILVKQGHIFRNANTITHEMYVKEKDAAWEADFWLGQIERQNKASDKLRFLNKVFERSTQPLLAFYSDGTIMTFNKALCDLLGYTRYEFSRIIQTNSDINRFIKKIIQEIKGKKVPYHLERKVKSRYGKELYLDIAVHKSFKRNSEIDYYYAFINDITENKRAEEELKKSEELYRIIADNALDMISIFSFYSNTYTYVSPSTIRVLGYSEEELLGASYISFVHPEDRYYASYKLAEGLSTGTGQAQYRLKKKDGSYIWVEAVGKLITRLNGKSEVLLVERNITGRKQAEEALKQNESRLRQITDNMLDIIVCINNRGIFTYVSPSVTGVLGYKPEELLNRRNISLVHPDDRIRIKNLEEDLLQESNTGRIECRVRHAEGYYIWLESVIKELSPNNAEFVAAMRDISMRKKAEQELKEQLNYQNSLINTMNETCYTYDQNMRITFVNQSALDTLGYTIDECIGRFILDFIAEEDKNYVYNEALLRITTGKNGRYETRIICKNGSVKLFNIKSSPIKENGRIVGGLVLGEDITEHRQMEEEMKRLAQLHTVGEIAAGIGHEIRNPMTTVKGFLQILKQNEDLNKYQQHFEVMLEELDRANTIISEFLSLAKNKLINLQLQDINRIILALFPLLQADAMLTDKSISLDLKTVPELLVDEKEIRQLILNLVRNGLEAMDTGGKVSISTVQRDDKVVLCVTDQGKGIAPELLDKLGTPFLTTKENGTGMGLAVCFGIADRHNAKIDYYSNEFGTTFEIKFKIP